MLALLAVAEPHPNTDSYLTAGHMTPLAAIQITFAVSQAQSASLADSASGLSGLPALLHSQPSQSECQSLHVCKAKMASKTEPVDVQHWNQSR